MVKVCNYICAKEKHRNHTQKISSVCASKLNKIVTPYDEQQIVLLEIIHHESKNVLNNAKCYTQKHMNTH